MAAALARAVAVPAVAELARGISTGLILRLSQVPIPTCPACPSCPVCSPTLHCADPSFRTFSSGTPAPCEGFHLYWVLALVAALPIAFFLGYFFGGRAGPPRRGVWLPQELR